MKDKIIIVIVIFCISLVIFNKHPEQQYVSPCHPEPIYISPLMPEPPPVPTIPNDPIPDNKEIDKILQGKSYAISAAVIKDGKFLYRKGFNANAYSNYRLASVSKQFTAGGIMILKDQGKLNFDDSIKTVFPDFPEWANRVTIRHLLNHNSGLPRDADSYVRGELRDEKIVDWLRTYNRSVKPGRHAYSNVGYSLLAQIISKVSGQSFPDFMKEHVFVPLGMKNTYIYEDNKDIPSRIFGKPSDHSRTSKTLGDGGVYTSVHEYWAWDQAFYDDRLFSKETLREALTPAPGTNYGFGWSISGGRVSHTGGTCGFSTCVYRYPHKNLCIIVLTGHSGGGASSLCGKIARLYLNRTSNLVDGTLIFSYNTGVIGRIARRVVGGDLYTHVAIILTGKDGNKYVYEQAPPASKRTLLGRHLIKGEVCHYFKPLKKFTPSQIITMQRDAELRLKKKYTLRYYFFPRLGPTRSGEWCSPYVGRTLNASGRYRITEKEWWEPQDLYNAIWLDYQRILAPEYIAREGDSPSAGWVDNYYKN